MESNSNVNRVTLNKDKSINILNSFLTDLINSGEIKNIKKADLVSYWIKDYSNYIKNEGNFIPFKQENYKRGNVIQVNLGFNIGSEEGGLHYAIVINNPKKSSNIVTIIPIVSKKDGKNLSDFEIPLGFEIMHNIISKLDIIYKNLDNNIKEMELIKDPNEQKKYLEKINIEFKILDKYLKHAKKMKKCESIALVGNITTISKQRIYTPTIENKILKGISISKEQLSLIDKKIIELYTKQ